jgi:hypothetical protein
MPSGRYFCTFPHIYVDAAYHLLPTEILTVPVIPGRHSVAERNRKPATDMWDSSALCALLANVRTSADVCVVPAEVKGLAMLVALHPVGSAASSCMLHSA